MPNKTNSKKNNAKTKVIGTIPKILIGLVGIAVIVLLIFLTIDCVESREYYECTLYTHTDKVAGGDDIVTDMLEPYSYYRLYIDEDSDNFTLKYKLAQSGQIEEYTGKYTIKDDVLTLKYDDFFDESFGDCVYTMKGNKLIREQFMTISESLRHTVNQEFK